MSYFAKGDFKIQDSWDIDKKPKSRDKSREKNPLFMNLGKNIAEPSTDILDDQVCKKILKDFQAEIPPPSSSGKSQKKIPNQQKKYPPKQKNLSNVGQSDDLLTSMAARLKQVQMTSNNQRLEIKQKNTLIQKLKTENAFLKGMKEDASSTYKEMEQIKQNNQELQKKVTEMESYLKKYGLKWVGHKQEGKLEVQQLKKDISKKFNYQLPTEIDINTINRRIHDLNSSLHQQGHGSQIYIENGIHKFRQAEPLTIGFYADGIAIKGFKFFPYNSQDSLRILSDILDGYFPYILKNKYPNGVFLKVLDRIQKKYDQLLQKGISSFQQAQEKALKPPSKEQFLNKLPKQVIKNGKVINIRSQIQKKLNGQQNLLIKNDEQKQHYQQVDGCCIFKTSIQQMYLEKKISQQQICEIKIRTDNNKTYLIRLSRDSKIKQIYDWMNKVFFKEYKLIGNYPRKVYDYDESQNLQKLGFFPNGMLNVHLKN